MSGEPIFVQKKGQNSKIGQLKIWNELNKYSLNFGKWKLLITLKDFGHLLEFCQNLV